jgi:hypothetical protein
MQFTKFSVFKFPHIKIWGTRISCFFECRHSMIQMTVGFNLTVPYSKFTLINKEKQTNSVFAAKRKENTIREL